VRAGARNAIACQFLRRLHFPAIILVGLSTWCHAGGDGAKGELQRVSSHGAKDGVLRVVLVGDSTVASYPSERGLRGWGQMLPEFFSTDVQIINLAKSGRSSGSYLREGLWDAALAENPDYFLIQFGHNDCPGKGDRSSDPNSTFQEHLRRYITDSKAIGAIPILVTPMSRRNFTQDGSIHTILRPYAAAMIKVGKQEDVAVIDLHTRSVELCERLGEAGSASLGADEGRDRTHFSPKGARAMARLVVEGLPEGPLRARARLPGEHGARLKARPVR